MHDVFFSGAIKFVYLVFFIALLMTIKCFFFSKQIALFWVQMNLFMIFTALVSSKYGTYMVILINKAQISYDLVFETNGCVKMTISNFQMCHQS